MSMWVLSVKDLGNLLWQLLVVVVVATNSLFFELIALAVTWPLVCWWDIHHWKENMASQWREILRWTFCNQWWSHISRIWEWRWWNGLLAVPNLNFIEHLWDHVGWLFNKCWLKKGLPSHSSVWPVCGGGAGLYWLCMVLKHTTEAQVY